MGHETKARAKTDRNIRRAFLARTALSKQKKKKKNERHVFACGMGICLAGERDSHHGAGGQVPHIMAAGMAGEHKQGTMRGRTACGIYAGCVTRMVPGTAHREAKAR